MSSFVSICDKGALTGRRNLWRQFLYLSNHGTHPVLPARPKPTPNKNIKSELSWRNCGGLNEENELRERV